MAKHSVRKRRSSTEAKSTRGSKAKPAADLTKTAMARRWTPKLVKGGFTGISNFLLEHGYELRPEMTGREMLFIIHLMVHKWDEKLPRPSYKRIATRMRLTDTSVRNIARSLEGKGYLRRIKRVARPNQFDLGPLFEKLEALMPVVEARKAKEKEEAEQD